MKGEPIKTTVLSAQIIPNADRALLRRLNVPENHRSLGIITTDCDDASYVAIDEATKKADVTVAYAKSFYAGSKNASTRLAGEFIGILTAEGPSEIKSGLDAVIYCLENDAYFISANDDNSIVYFAHCISRTGSYLSNVAGVREGEPLAYLIAPPMEAIVGLDAAVKAAETQMTTFYGPPTETNFAGGLLTGEQSACQAACCAFARRVCEAAETPIDY